MAPWGHGMGLSHIIYAGFAAFALASALAVVFTKNTVHSALYFVTHLLCVSVLYALLQAPLIAVLQVAIYAGAVMVLFIFAIMILDASILEKMSPSLERGQIAAAISLALALLLGFMSLTGRFHLESLLAPVSGTLAEGNESIAAIARLLYGKYLAAFELVGILLFVAVVGIMVMAKRRLDS